MVAIAARKCKIRSGGFVLQKKLLAMYFSISSGLNDPGMT